MWRLGTNHCPLFQLMRTERKKRTSHNRLRVYLETQHTDLWDHRQADAASYHTAKNELELMEPEW